MAPSDDRPTGSAPTTATSDSIAATPQEIRDRLRLLCHLSRAIAHELGNMILPNESALGALDGEKKALGHLERLTESLDTVEEVRRTLQTVKATREGPHARLALPKWWNRHSKIICAVFRPYATDSEIPEDLPDAHVGENAWTLAFLATLVGMDHQPEGRIRVEFRRASDSLRVVVRPEDFALNPASAASSALVASEFLEPFGGGCAHEPEGMAYSLVIADGEDEIGW